MSKNIIVIKTLPVLLNKLYIPIIKKGKPAIVKNKAAKDFLKLVAIECLRQKAVMIEGTVSFKCDFLIKDRKDIDIDAILKLLLDSFQGVCYKDDKLIIELIIRKHLNAEYDGLNVCIESKS